MCASLRFGAGEAAWFRCDAGQIRWPSHPERVMGDSDRKRGGVPSGVIRTDDTAMQIRRGPGGEIGWASSSIWALNCRMVVEREKDRPSHSHLT